MPRKSSKSRTKKKLWTPPYNHQEKRFKLRGEWTKSEERAYAKAKRDGSIKASKQAKKQLRGPKGKFVSKTPKKVSTKTPSAAAAALAAPAEVVWVEREHECPPCAPVFPGLAEKVAYPIEQTSTQVAQIQRDLAEMKSKLRLAPQQPVANPIETLAIINRTERPEGVLAKLSDAAKDNPLIAMALVGVAIFVGYIMYRSYRSTQDVTPDDATVADLAMQIERGTNLPGDDIPRYGPPKTVDQPSNINLPGSTPAFGNNKDGEGIFS